MPVSPSSLPLSLINQTYFHKALQAQSVHSSSVVPDTINIITRKLGLLQWPLNWSLSILQSVFQTTAR
jgi:hypothetical protein